MSTEMNNSTSDVSPYGFCPKCGEKGYYRERRLNGNDRCLNNHLYPSSTSLDSRPSTRLEQSEYRLRKFFKELGWNTSGDIYVLVERLIYRVREDKDLLEMQKGLIDKLSAKNTNPVFLAAYLIPQLLTFKNATSTSCPIEYQDMIEGTVGWSPSMIGDAPSVTDKFGITHSPIPLYSIKKV